MTSAATRFPSATPGFSENSGGHPSLDLVDDRHDRRFGHPVDGKTRRFDLLGAQPVPGDVDHIVYPPEDSIVTVGSEQSSVGGEVRPVPPILAFRVPAVLAVVLRHEAVPVAPDRLHDSRPRIPDADVARLVGTERHLLPVLVEDDRVNAESGGARASRFHRIQRGNRGTEKTTRLGLPPGVYDDRLALAHRLVVPAPGFGLDRLTDRGHVLEPVAVLLRLVGTGLPQHADRRRRGVKDVDVKLLRDPPRPAGIGEGRHTFVDHTGGRQRQRAIDDVRVTGNPPDVGHAPVNILRSNVLVILRGPGDVREIPAGPMLAPLGLAGRAARVHQKERRLRVH